MGSNSTGSEDVCCACCVLSGIGLCDELITSPEESYGLWCVVVCDIESSRTRNSRPALNRSGTREGGEGEIRKLQMWSRATYYNRLIGGPLTIPLYGDYDQN